MQRLFNLFLITIMLGSHASNAGVLFEKITQAHNNGTVFQTISLFSVGDAPTHSTLLKSERILLPVTSSITSLYQNKYKAVSLQLQAADGNTYVLEMMQSSPFASDAKIDYQNANGIYPTNVDKGLHYQGALAGMSNSFASMSVFANGDVMILFGNDYGNFVLGKLEDGSGKYILYNDKDFKDRPYAPCGVDDDMYNRAGSESAQKTTGYICKKVRMYWEADYQLYKNRQNSVTLAQNYLSGLFNQVQTLYANETIIIELSGVKIWTTDDGYIDTSSGAALTSFQNRWNSAGNAYDGDIAHLLACDNKGNGGVAYVNVLCKRNTAFAYSEVHVGYNTVPTYSWDVEVCTHEEGHNLSSRHTHWCGWNTGSLGTCGSIDNCYKQESTSLCSTCPSTYDNAASTSAWEGTIMSYCHLVARGINLANGFGPLPGNAIRNAVSISSCLTMLVADSCFPIATNVTVPVSNGSQVYVYPNPADKVLYIDRLQTDARVQLFDMFGREVFVIKSTQQKEMIDMSLLTSGNYILQVTTPQGERIIQKVSKE
ncbi:MAG: zinc-dependent metalloprotease [Bacteroidetes bacterium]|nr:zinc-dependent metalloprotease [Bacteroidota bacterium]